MNSLRLINRRIHKSYHLQSLIINDIINNNISNRYFSSETVENSTSTRESGLGSGTHAKFDHSLESSKSTGNLATCAFRVADRPGNLYYNFYHNKIQEF